jgi:hypothetical protein
MFRRVFFQKEYVEEKQMFDFILVKTHFQRLKYFISLLKERKFSDEQS